MPADADVAHGGLRESRQSQVALRQSRRVTVPSSSILESPQKVTVGSSGRGGASSQHRQDCFSEDMGLLWGVIP